MTYNRLDIRSFIFMSNSVLSCRYFCIISGIRHVLLLQQGHGQIFHTGGAKLKYISNFGHTHFHTPDTCAGNLAGQPYNLFCARRDNKNRIISAYANIGLARQIIVHVRSSIIKVDVISLDSIDTLIMLIVYFPFLY